MLPINSNTSPEELERMLFPISPELADIMAEQIDLSAEVSRLEDELAETQALLDQDLLKDAKESKRAAHHEYERHQETRQALRDLFNLIASTPRVPVALRKQAKAIYYKVR